MFTLLISQGIEPSSTSGGCCITHGICLILSGLKWRYRSIDGNASSMGKGDDQTLRLLPLMGDLTGLIHNPRAPFEALGMPDLIARLEFLYIGHVLASYVKPEIVDSRFRARTSVS